jgi:hypothetical protein
VSDITQQAPTFFALYSQGRASAEQIEDHVGAWHDSGDDETRELHEYLGMTDEEYDVWLMTPRTLPLLVEARRTGRPLRKLVEGLYQDLCAANDPKDQPTIYRMSYWLYDRPPSA